MCIYSWIRFALSIFLESVLIVLSGGALMSGAVEALGAFKVYFLNPSPAKDSFAPLTEA